MKAVDFIVKHIDENGMTQSEAAAVAGMSRQNFWDKLNNRMNTLIDNMRYRVGTCRARIDALSPSGIIERRKHDIFLKSRQLDT